MTMTPTSPSPPRPQAKLSGEQAAAYARFAGLLADLDPLEMVQLLEAALADAQALTGLGDFYGTAPGEEAKVAT